MRRLFPLRMTFLRALRIPADDVEGLAASPTRRAVSVQCKSSGRGVLTELGELDSGEAFLVRFDVRV